MGISGEDFRGSVKMIHQSLVVFFAFVAIISGFLIYLAVDPGFSAFKEKKVLEYANRTEVDEDLIVDGIHVRTGLIADDGLMEVVYNCTICHSAKLVIQNRMNKERWAATIDWMQATQNLADLGKNEEIIINYLVKNYPPRHIGRRMALTDIEWYELE